MQELFPCPKDTSQPPIQQPSIEVLGIRVDEPVMVATDLLVAAVCFYAWFRISKLPVKNEIRTLTMIYFASMGAATAIGGIIGHGLIHYFNFYYKLPAWITSMISIAMLERVCIKLARPYIQKSVGVFFGWVNMIELLTFMFISFYSLCFFYVEAHAAYGLVVVVFSFSVFVYWKTRNEAMIEFFVGVALATISAIIFTFDLYINEWITHVDLGHLFMALAAWFFYRGSAKILHEIEAGRLRL